ncbi:MAG TPA: helix-turn-helix domain-containing protein, partial [Vicinamibacteria bacterium]|nr:helix-turn-helix domain-containing protein [Vicinamibacteria bacterium]
MLLDYLVTGRVRLQLLRLLWGEGARGTVSELARAARTSFAAAHKELAAMEAVGLVSARRAGGRAQYAARPDYPEARLLRGLLAKADAESHSNAGSAARDNDDQAAMDFLSAHGAPWGAGAPGSAGLDAEALTLHCLDLARRDATVARVLPLVLWRLRATLDWDKLVEQAKARGQAHVLGLFLEIAGRFGGDKALRSLSRRLRDRRRTRPRLFFLRPHGPEALRTARRNTPAPARRFGFTMNLGLDSF